MTGPGTTRISMTPQGGGGGGGIEDSGWIEMAPLLNGWVAVTTPEYRKINQVVYVRGELDGTVVESELPAFVLAAPYRPDRPVVDAILTGVDSIETNGNVGALRWGTNSFVLDSLSGYPVATP